MWQVRKYYAFLNIGDLGEQKKVLEHLIGFYPSGSRFVILSMDMEYMGAGVVQQSLTDQLNDLAQLKKDPAYQGVLLPFVFAHPERNDLLSLVRYYIEEENFAGIKIYPAIGYFPNDKRLHEVYAYAEQNQIPIMTHCTRGGVFYKGVFTEQMRKDPDTGEIYPMQKASAFTDVYSDPRRYSELLKKFPKLKLCFGHFGGAKEWDAYLHTSWSKTQQESWFSLIKEMMLQYENVYADISYTLCDKQYFNLLKITLLDKALRQKILFGSDYYMLEQELTEREFGINLRAFLGEDDFQQIAETNPKKFLTKPDPAFGSDITDAVSTGTPVPL